MLLAEGDGFLVGEGARGGGEEDEGLVAEVAWGDDAAFCEGMVGGEDGDEGLGEERLDAEAFDGAAVAEEAGVEHAAVEGGSDAGCVGLGELELDAWVEQAIAAEHGGDGGEHAGADEADAQGSDVSAADGAGFFDVFVDVAQGAAGTLEEDFAGGGELNGA
jgi:hypothetical protein